MSARHTTRRPVLGRRPRAAAAMVGAAAVVAVGLAAVSVTVASYQDRAHVNLGTDGVGSADPFGIVLVDGAGTVQDAPAGDSLAVDVPGAGALAPGRTVEAVVVVANNHPAIAAGLSVSVTGEALDESRDITEFLRFSVLDGEGESLSGGSRQDPAAGLPLGEAGDAGVLAARGEAPIEHGGPWSAGAEGSTRTVTVLVHMLAEPATEMLNGGQAHLAVQVHGTSVDP